MNPKEASRVERKKEKTKQQILTVALRLFKQHGFDVTTMEQIAEEADIAKGTLYNYFPAKETIISEYVQRSFKERYPDRILQFRTMLEFYQAYATYEDLVRLTEEMISGLALSLLGTTEVTVQGQTVDFSPPWERITVAGAVARYGGVPEERLEDPSFLRETARRLGLPVKDHDSPGRLLVDLFEFVFVEVAKQFYMQPKAFNARVSIEQGVDLFMNGATNTRND